MVAGGASARRRATTTVTNHRPLLAPPAARHTSPGEQLVELRGRQMQADNLNLMPRPSSYGTQVPKIYSPSPLCIPNPPRRPWCRRGRRSSSSLRAHLAPSRHVFVVKLPSTQLPRGWRRKPSVGALVLETTTGFGAAEDFLPLPARNPATMLHRYNSTEECRLLFPQRRMRMSNQGVLPRSFAYKMFPDHHCVSTRALSTVKLE